MSHITWFYALNIHAVFMLDMQNVSIGQNTIEHSFYVWSTKCKYWTEQYKTIQDITTQDKYLR
jgi:hypothetical protein